ncbi:Nicotianamine synthase [Apodospora peruviana]|uniref:Nicotianamine synthase n=1 Tax=Apodospora peruviana TaxID=516989 RepID=A0AAE0IJH5_9PEZI|nr:Nicotianamine synthase [Apodospora peruviana]
MLAKMQTFLCWLPFRSPKAKASTSPAASRSCPTLAPTSSHYTSQDTIVNIEKSANVKDQLQDAKMENGKVEEIRGKILETYAKLVELKGDYRPGETINKLLGNLVPVCAEIHDQETVKQVVENAEIQAILPGLRQICSASESCLESYWADRIIQGEPGDEAVTRLKKEFLYFGNYEQLAWLEYCGILAARRTPPKKVAFIGSGPLPLTSLCLLQELKKDYSPSTITILNIDISQAAIDVSKKLCDSLGEWAHGMEFACDKAGSSDLDLQDFDVVYVAALVGISQDDKESIVVDVANTMRPGALLVVRSTLGLRTCLYPEVDMAKEKLLEKLEPCLTLHPHDQVVNSFIVTKVKE